MKKFLSLFAALTIALGATACGSTNNGSSSNGNPTDTNTESATETTAETSDLETETTTQTTTATEETTATTTAATTTTTVTTTAVATEETTAAQTTTAADETSETANITDLDGISVDRNLLTVSITIPSGLISDTDSYTAELENNASVASYAVNNDGSVTIEYYKDDYDEMLAEYKKSTEESLTKLVTDGTYSSVTAIDFNDDFSDVTVTVTDQDSYENSFDGFIETGITLTIAFYQYFSGYADYHTTIHIVDSNGNEFKTTEYPQS